MRGDCRQQQAAPQDAAAGVASWLDGPQLRLALPGRAQLATGIWRGRAPLAEHGQLTAVGRPGQAGHPEVPVAAAGRSAPPEALRAGGGVDDDELVGPLRAVQLAAVAVIALVVGPDSQQRAVGRGRQRVRRPPRAQHAAGYPGEAGDLPGRGEPEPVDLLARRAAAERGDVERAIARRGQRGRHAPRGLERGNRDDRDGLAGGGRPDRGLPAADVGGQVEPVRGSGEMTRPGGLVRPEQPVRHRHDQADHQHHGRGRGRGCGPGRLVPPALPHGQRAQLRFADGAGRGAHRVGQPVLDAGHRSSPSRLASVPSPRAAADFTEPWLMPSMAATSATGRFR